MHNLNKAVDETLAEFDLLALALAVDVVSVTR